VSFFIASPLSGIAANRLRCSWRKPVNLAGLTQSTGLSFTRRLSHRYNRAEVQPHRSLSKAIYSAIELPSQ
jgi:hypothetical protein